MTFVADGVELKYDRLCLTPLGGQSEIGRVLWAFSFAGEILLVDAGASYPGTALPGVDLLLPNMSFLQSNQDRILALVLTNGHEEHSGAVDYVLEHLKIPRIMAPRFVAALLSQRLMNKAAKNSGCEIDTIETRRTYQIGSFEAEWIQVNDAIADACGLRIGTPAGNIVYTSSFKLDQTPIDGRQMDIGRLAAIGDQGVLALLSDSAGVESHAYTPSEKVVAKSLDKYLSEAPGRVIVVLNGTNTLRMQVLFDLARKFDRKVILVGETLLQTAVAAAITGNLSYDRSLEAQIKDLPKLPDNRVLVLATGEEGDAMQLMFELAHGRNKEFSLKKGDLVVYSDEIYPGEARKMAVIMDQLLSAGINEAVSTKSGVHVSNHAGREELKLMLSITKPKYVVPIIGESRHIMHHAQLAIEFGVPAENVFPLRNGDILEVTSGSASVIGSVEAQAIYFNRDLSESVTAFSVNERRSLSMDGVITVGVVVDTQGNLLEEPIFEGAALGFLESSDWATLKGELLENISLLAQKHRQETWELTNFKSGLRDLVSKSIRSRLSVKPAVIAIVHELNVPAPVHKPA